LAPPARLRKLTKAIFPWLWWLLLPAIAACAGAGAVVEMGLVDVGGHQLYINCTGTGAPAVVLEAGLDSGSEAWSDFQPGVAGFTQVCSYDRAGLGRSEAGPKPRTSQNIVDDLHRLLSNAGVRGPYVMVGHSFGGMNVRLYAAQHPQEVAGVLLVDSLHPDSLSRIREVLGEIAWGEIAGQTNQNDERVDLVQSSAQVGAAGNLGATPLVVLTAGRRVAAPFSTSPHIAARLEELWLELQDDLPGLSSNSTHIIARRSGHSIQSDEPQLVVDAIRQVVESSRR
jgi:thioesterase domain-containing protein